MDSKEIHGARIDVPRLHASRGDARRRPLLHLLQENMRQIHNMLIEQMYQTIG